MSSAIQFPVAPGGSLERLEALLFESGGELRARYLGLELASVFQPIISPVHRRTVGYEALIRARTLGGEPVSPLELFARAQNPAAILELDRLARLLHVANFARQDNGDTWLFLNINPVVLTQARNHRPFFAQLLERYGLAPQRVVVEILEGHSDEEDRLAQGLDYYRSLGCLVAIDDFGSGHSNFSRVVRLAPQLVKLDRSLIADAAGNPLVRRMLPNLVALLHETGGLVLVEGIETREEALLALDADADFMQGWYFARPQPLTAQPADSAAHLPGLEHQYRRETAGRQEQKARTLAPYRAGLAVSAAALAAGRPVAQACRPLLELDRVIRCYLLDGDGRQRGDNLVPPERAAQADPRFRPLYDTEGANWQRRPYFRRAVARPGEVQVTRPYLSLTGATLCVTLSLAWASADNVRVLCCDLEWKG